MEHTGLLFLLTCQPAKSSNFSRSGINVRAHLLHKNYSRNFSSIQSAPMSFKGYARHSFYKAGNDEKLMID